MTTVFRFGWKNFFATHRQREKGQRKEGVG